MQAKRRSGRAQFLQGSLQLELGDPSRDIVRNGIHSHQPNEILSESDMRET